MFIKYRDEKETFLEFVERVKKAGNESLLYQFDVLFRFAETPIMGCYFNEVQNYVRCIEATMKETMYVNVFLEHKIVHICSIYSDKKGYIRRNMNKLKKNIKSGDQRS